MAYNKIVIDTRQKWYQDNTGCFSGKQVKKYFMSSLFNELTSRLKKKKIRPSYQRLKVLEYLTTHRSHPTVNQIYNDLCKEVPTLSKTTVYNALNTLLEAGLVKVVNIEENETRYDFNIKDHGHFKCNLCGTIYDFSIDLDTFSTEELSGFKITDKDVYFKGICSRCLSNKE